MKEYLTTVAAAGQDGPLISGKVSHFCSFAPPFESLSALFKADAAEKKKTEKKRISLSIFKNTLRTQKCLCVFVCVYALKGLVRKIDSIATLLMAGVFVRLACCF